MIAVIIFTLHLGAAGYAFETRRRKGEMSEGILAVAFMALIFSVGWSIATMVTRFLFPPEGLAEWLDADALSLVLLTLGEVGFYAIALRLGKRSEENSERSTST